jgi:NDP-sugar pyrophosphorylase family protein
MLEASGFFDLSTFAHAALFEGTRFVWEALERLPEYIAEHMAGGLDGRVMPGALIEGEVYLGEGTVVQPGAMIVGPAIIGKNCQVRHGAFIRGHVILGDRAVVGHATEVKTAVLLDDAAAPHFNYVGDSILGARVNLGAGSICSNFKMTHEPIVVRVGDQAIETGMRKLGAILGDGVEIGCNAVLNPGTLIGPGSLVYPTASVRGWHPAGSVIKLRQQVETAQRR